MARMDGKLDIILIWMIVLILAGSTALLRKGHNFMIAHQFPIDRADAFVVVAGPTASGKSAMSLDIARQIDGNIINADSLQVYRDLNILSARPDAASLLAVPHALYGVMDGADRCSVGIWLELARLAVAEARNAGKVPILVGGTGMYLNASLMGISTIPDIPKHVRTEMTAMHKKMGAERFHATLNTYDPVLASRLASSDKQRLIRGMEVFMHTKTPLSWWQKQPLVGRINGCGHTVVLNPPREAVYKSIDCRLESMVEKGAIEEVERLVARQLDPGLPVMKALGVSQIARFLKGTLTRDDAIFQAKQASRHYAKRQMTWIRNNFISNYEINETYSKSLLEKNFPIIFS